MQLVALLERLIDLKAESLREGLDEGRREVVGVTICDQVVMLSRANPVWADSQGHVSRQHIVELGCGETLKFINLGLLRK